VFCVYVCLLYVWFVCVLFVPSVLWYCWLGLLACKNRLPYNLYCVGGDVKHYSIQSWGPPDLYFVIHVTWRLLSVIVACDVTSRTMFVCCQTELEECTETLSEMVARPYLRTPRTKIVQTAHLVQRKRHELVAAIAKGLVPPDTSPATKRKKNFHIDVRTTSTELCCICHNYSCRAIIFSIVLTCTINYILILH